MQKELPIRTAPCVLVKGFEPPRFPRLILSQMRMPFRHTSEQKVLYHILFQIASRECEKASSRWDEALLIHSVFAAIISSNT